jgi:hypothetical protein
MSFDGTAVAAMDSSEEPYEQLSNNQSTQKTMKQRLEPVRGVLQSIADLRRYILTEHPSMLPDAAPSLLYVENEIFTIWNNIDSRGRSQ